MCGWTSFCPFTCYLFRLVCFVTAVGGFLFLLLFLLVWANYLFRHMYSTEIIAYYSFLGYRTVLLLHYIYTLLDIYVFIR